MFVKYLLIFSYLFISCSSKKNQDQKYDEQKETVSYKQYSIVSRDSFSSNSSDEVDQEDIRVEKNIDLIIDTSGLFLSPVIITKSWLTKEEYSNYKDIALSYKNVSSKRIKAIRFKWYGETAFGEPADMGNYSYDGFGSGFTETPLNPGKSSSGEWPIFSKTAFKIILAWPTEVAFVDGTKWRIGNF